MKKMISLFLLSAVCFLATGCGVKGPLYFPEDAQKKEQQRQEKKSDNPFAIGKSY